MEFTSKVMGERIKRYLKEGKRFDERKPEEFREITVETGVSKNAEGSARVKVGKTEVLVGVKMDVSEPYPDSPDKGNLMVTAELLPLSSPRYESGPPRFSAIELGRVLDRCIRESKFIQLDKLCIKEGEKVWNVLIDVYSINDDGNLIDAAAIGAVIALKDAKIPKYDEKEEKVLFGEWSDKKIPVSKEVPISITVCKVGEGILVDPNKEEEDLIETRITIGSSEGIIFSMQKGESKSLSKEEFNNILKMLEEAYKDVHKKIQKFIK